MGEGYYLLHVADLPYRSPGSVAPTLSSVLLLESQRYSLTGEGQQFQQFCSFARIERARSVNVLENT